MSEQDIININIGILGHVDSGKTSLAKCLSSISSTAAFDKNPQSQERGITLDLGFSSFSLPIPDHLNSSGYKAIQYTLVDCPGHASLIKTIIGGAQIIDMMLLVIDVNKGIQTQTAECLVIGEITCKKMIVVLNKIDLLKESEREKIIIKVKNRVEKVLSTTDFQNDVPMIPVSANCENLSGIEEMKQLIAKVSFIPVRSANGPFLFAVDHCFAIKGQGTVMTGTVLQGSVAINDVIDIPLVGVTKKIKSMQMFKKPISKAIQGDRLGICVTQFDSKLLERGIVCSPGHGCFINCAVMKINLIKYFTFDIENKMKFHVTLGYENVMAKVTLFKLDKNKDITLDREYEFVEKISSEKEENPNNNLNYGVLLEFEKNIFAVNETLVIGSKLDTDINKNVCRIAFWGHLNLELYSKTLMDKLNIFKIKTKEGVIDRIVNNNTVIVKGLFKKESNIEKFTGLEVTFEGGQKGRICGSFGQSGKIKISLQEDLKTPKDQNKVTFCFKKYLFQNKTNKIKQ